MPGVFWYWVKPSLRRTTDVRGGHVFILSLVPRSSDIIQHESPSKGHHEYCLPRLTAQGLSRPRVSIKFIFVPTNGLVALRHNSLAIYIQARSTVTGTSSVFLTVVSTPELVAALDSPFGARTGA